MGVEKISSDSQYMRQENFERLVEHLCAHSLLIVSRLVAAPKSFVNVAAIATVFSNVLEKSSKSHPSPKTGFARTETSTRFNEPCRESDLL